MGSELKRSPRRLARGLVGAAAMGLLLAGCASPGGGRAESATGIERMPAHQGKAWEVVLPGASIAGVALIPEQWRAEGSRNDAYLGVREYRLATATDEWPETRPDLSRPRYIYLPRSSDRMLYFLPERNGRRGGW